MSILGVGAWTLAVGRVGVGAGLAAAPQPLAAMWVGDEAAASPQTQMLARSLGVRDAVIGAGTALALVRGRSARSWFLAGALCDVADLAATAVAREHLPKKAFQNTVAVVVPTVLLGLAVAARSRR